MTIYPHPTRKGRRRGLDCDMRYFTTEFLMSPSPGWEVNCWGDNWQHWEDTVVKHLETGHIWKLTGEREPWGDTLIWPGRWPD